ncbi:uncharacterized protein LOC130216296 isoform X2 [Danio aesculapii]|uniref:uncharacterized protein LOC130216296 isoform X2 n=1 Tax=Danio aesculapii TaxID=1142201 RepID=UPI0024BF2218|nr:uncharacterized protein LOC130216296 isoform X2 [Danio aesculapii]
MEIVLTSLFFLIAGVSGTEIGAAQFISLMEGDSVTLQTNLTEILNDDTIVWLFGPKETMICHIQRAKDFTSQYVTEDVEFSSRVQVEQKTGSITIRNTRVRHSGEYKLTVFREKTMTKIFNVTVLVVAGEMDGVKSVSRFVKEGESVTLHTDEEIPKDALMLWRFGDNAVLLAKVDVEANQTSLNDDERFRGRLKVDQLGALTIPNTKTTDSGLYELQIRGIERLQRFVVSVSAHPDQGLSSGAIAGIVIGVSLLIVASALIYYPWRMFKLKKQQAEEQITVMEGDSVTLKTGHTEIQQNEIIEWYYEVEQNVIAEIKEETRKTHDGADGRFRSKLSLNANGDLTMSNTRTIHSGLYIVKIRTKTTTKPIYSRFIVIISVNSKSVQEQGTVTLQTKAEILGDDLILWTFGAENCLVVRAASDNTSFGERFRDRVQLDHQTGSLIITNITNKDSGLFKLQITNSEKTRFRRFNMKITASTGVGSATVLTPLIGGDVMDGENEQQTSSL